MASRASVSSSEDVATYESRSENSVGVTTRQIRELILQASSPISRAHNYPPSETDTSGARIQILLPLVLAAVAGAVDVIGLLNFKLFTAHITGNLVLIADQMVREGRTKLDEIISVPVFVLAVSATWLLSKLSGLRGLVLLRLLLIVHLLMLTAVWIVSILSHPVANPAGLRAGAGAMIAVSAMACQFTLLQLGVPGAPTTAVMTGNMTKTVLSVLEALAPGAPIACLDNERPTESLELVCSFFAGCLAGAQATSWMGDWAWILPVVLAGVALAMTVKPA